MEPEKKSMPEILFPASVPTFNQGEVVVIIPSRNWQAEVIHNTAFENVPILIPSLWGLLFMR